MAVLCVWIWAVSDCARLVSRSGVITLAHLYPALGNELHRRRREHG